MNKSVFIIRTFNRRNECLSIYGVYSDLDKAVSELNACGYEFDEIQWVWRDTHLGHLYRIDEYTVQ